jgi:hypothetical protein
VHFEARLARGSSHRQAMQQELEILVRDIEQSSR